MPVLFYAGRLLITSAALSTLDPTSVLLGIRRHIAGDWGDLCDEDKVLNDEAVLQGDRLLSAYHDEAGTKFWIITEHDRSSTTVLLPDDY